MQAALTLALRRGAQAEQQLTRLVLQQHSARLGFVTHERHGQSLTEVWQDGMAFTKLKQAMVELQARKERELRAKEAADKARKAAKKTGADEARAARELEVCTVRLEACRRDEAQIAAQLGELEAEKQLHIRALRRVADEDASQFVNARALCNGRYVLLKLLGRGGFSEVFHAYDIVMLREVAVKVHQLNSGWSRERKENYTKHATAEYEIQKRLRHPRIVALLDVFEINADSFATVLEYCGGDDLDTQLRRLGALPEREARLVVQQMLDGLRYLASQPQPVIHYDLKPANILFDADGNAKIADFGLSKQLPSDDKTSIELTSHGAGTYWYLPPECFTEQKGAKISLKVDVWSVGVIFYQLLFGQKPFGHGLSQQRILMDQVIQKATHVAFPATPKVSDAAKQFIQKLLAYEPSVRPTVHDAAEDPYLRP